MSNWEVSADLVLVVLAGEQRDGKDEHFIRALEAGFDARHLPDGKARNLWKTMQDFRRNNTPLQPGAVDAPMMAYLTNLLTTYGDTGKSSLTGGVFDVNVKKCKEHAARALTLRALRETAAQIEGNGALAPALAYLEDQLKATRTGDEAVNGETAAELGRTFRERMTSPPPPLHKFGLATIDEWTAGGIPAGMDYVLSIAAPAKSRKTSLALNMVLNFLRQGLSCTVCMLEDNRDRITATLVCMMAIDWMMARGIADQPTRPGSPILNRNISADLLFKHGNKIFSWQDERVKALQAAIDEYEGFAGRLRIYDQTRAGGGVAGIADLQRVLERDLLVRGRPDLVMLDHAQRITDGDGDYQKLQIVGHFVEGFARRERLALVLLAQTRSGTDGTMDDAATRGGTKLDEMSDALMGVRYDELTPEQIQVKMFKQRRGPSGMRASLLINPDTGRILNGGQKAQSLNLNDL
jgi:hypothetical protein